MSYPVLFGPKGEPTVGFQGNGYGVLSDCVDCKVTEERNGSYELEMAYPIDGIHYGQLVNRSILMAEAHPAGSSHNTNNVQPFRIYRITRPMNGVIKIYAHHYRYDLSGAVTSPCSASNAPAAMTAIKTNSIGVEKFNFYTDKTTVANMSVKVPKSTSSQLAGEAGSVLDVYGGEWEFDGKIQNGSLLCDCHLWGERGYNRGVTIRYGKNLVDLTQEENFSSVYTGVVPYWSGGEGEEATVVTGDPVSAGEFDYTKLKVVDFSSDFEEQPTPAQLEARAASYIQENRIGIPVVSLSVKFEQLSQFTEYEDRAVFENLQLCDTVNVYFEKLGVNTTAKVVKTVYDTILEKYDTIEVGEARTSIADTIAEQQKEIENPEITTAMRSAINRATKAITGNLGGYVILHDANGDGKPDEILIMDTEDIETAQNVWRWNQGGLGYSSDGYSGNFETAITADGEIVADFITTGTLDASVVTAANIVAGFIRNASSTFEISLDNGTITIKGSTVRYRNSDYTAVDYQKASQYILGRVILTPEEMVKYDTTGEGNITITDVVQINAAVQGIGTLDFESTWTLTLSPTLALRLTRHYKNNISGDESDIVALSTQGGVVSAMTLSTDQASIKEVIAKTGAFDSGLTLGGNPVLTTATGVSQTVIGYFVYGGQSSYKASIFIPYGVSGRFQLGSDDWYSGFYFDGYGNASYQVGTSISYSVEPVYNY